MYLGQRFVAFRIKSLDVIINLTNHPSSTWQKKELETLAKYGEIVDLPFPHIAPEASIDEVRDVAGEYLQRVEEMKPDAVCLAGEFTFTFMCVDELLQKGFKVFIGASDRNVVEEKLSDGTYKKTLVFEFVQERKYARLCE